MTKYSEKLSNTTLCFSSDYEVARKRFQVAATESGGRLVSLRLAATTPDRNPLTIDIAWFGPEYPKRVFVHSSGLHGVEAFAGSAIQLRWLRGGLAKIPADSAVVLVHVLNPYGMAWLRRCNENNVDLNRNFREPGIFDCDPPPYWDAVNALLNPPTLPKGDGFYFRAAWLVLRHGMPAMRQAAAGGQCLNPKGLFFAGTALEEGPAKFREFMKARLSGAERIVSIDVHTGLGRFGEDRLLIDAGIDRTDASHVMKKVFGKRLALLDNRGSVYSAKGTLQEMYCRSFPRAQVHFAAQEFGTYSPLRVIKTLRDENRWHMYGRRGVNHPTKRALLETFAPMKWNWRTTVLERGAEVIRQALRLAFEDNLHSRGSIGSLSSASTPKTHS